MLTKNYITPALGGRLGNNLFMIAHAYVKGLEFNKQVVISKDQLIYEGNDYSQNIFKKLEMKEKYEALPYINNPIPSDKEPTLYSGYFQSEEYFEKYSENIKSLFGPSLEFIEKIKIEIPSIFNTITTVINVRRGDYLFYPDYHPVISIEFIENCLQQIQYPGQIVIASDDISWCKENIKVSNAIYIEGYKAHEQLWILSMCTNFIISNSSFSWWAAYLSRAENKIVLAPETWFGPEGPPTWQNIYCKDWTIVPTYFSNGKIYPK